MKRIGASVAVMLCAAFTVNGCALFKGKPKPLPPAEEQVLNQIAPETAKKSWIPNPFAWLKRKPQTPRAMPVNPVGRIFVYNAVGKYAVVESGGVGTLPPGTLLATIKDGVITSQLKVSAQSRAPFLIADQYFGKPEKDDKVFVIDE